MLYILCVTAIIAAVPYTPIAQFSQLTSLQLLVIWQPYINHSFTNLCSFSLALTTQKYIKSFNFLRYLLPRKQVFWRYLIRWCSVFVLLQHGHALGRGATRYVSIKFAVTVSYAWVVLLQRAPCCNCPHPGKKIPKFRTFCKESRRVFGRFPVGIMFSSGKPAHH